MAVDFIPRTDGDFYLWEQSFMAYAGAHLTELGLVAGDLTDLTALEEAWNGAYVALEPGRTTYEAIVQTKCDCRAAYEAALRAFVRRLQASSAVSDSERQALGITVRDTTATPTPAPVTRPVLQVDISEILRHVLAFADEGTPTKKQKPAGVHGLELWSKIGPEAPTTDAEWVFVAVDTATPYLAEFGQAQIGQTVWYRARWVNTRQEHGPWSQTVSAKVPG